MAIPDEQKINFETLKRAILEDNACLVESHRWSNGETVDMICAVLPEVMDGQEYVRMIPLAVMPRDNMRDNYAPVDLVTEVIPKEKKDDERPTAKDAPADGSGNAGAGGSVGE